MHILTGASSRVRESKEVPEGGIKLGLLRPDALYDVGSALPPWARRCVEQYIRRGLPRPDVSAKARAA